MPIETTVIKTKRRINVSCKELYEIETEMRIHTIYL